VILKLLCITTSPESPAGVSLEQFNQQTFSLRTHQRRKPKFAVLDIMKELFTIIGEIRRNT
jgi:hypothetical protein